MTYPTCTSASPIVRQPAAALWVDDRPNEIERLGGMLCDQGVEVRIAKSFAEAKKEAGNCSYDLILVDLRLDESDGIVFSEYAKRLVANRFHRSIHFGAVTNFKDEYDLESQKQAFAFVYDKSELANGESKRFVEDCLFSAADSSIRAHYAELGQYAVPDFVEPDMVDHVRCDIGYILRSEGSHIWASLWRCGNPLDRTIRVFDRVYLTKRGICEAGQPFRIDTFDGKSSRATLTVIAPIQGASDRTRRRIAQDVDLERFRKGTDE